MNTKEQILDLYYNEHLKQNEIAKVVGKSCPYVSKVVKTDDRNKQEKENRKKTNYFFHDHLFKKLNMFLLF